MKKKSHLLKLSASSIKTYEQCPRKWYYTYIERRPRKKWEHLDLGNFVHDALEEFHNEAPKKKREEWPALMTAACEKFLTEYHLSVESQKKAKEMLATYLSILGEEGLPPVLANEQEFKLFIEDENIQIRGFIDRIDQDEDGFALRDYKTGKSAYLDEFQLLVYGLYLLDEYGDIERFKGSYIMLKEGSKHISYTFTKTDLDRCLNKIKQIARQIRAEKTWDPRPQFLCSYCDFEEVCPATEAKRSQSWSQKSTLS